MAREISNEKLRLILDSGSETLDVEIKGPMGMGDVGVVAKVAKACLGLTNRDGGGTVVIGVREIDGGPFDVVGLNEEQLATWTPDELKDKLAPFCEPQMEVQLERRMLDTRQLVLIHVEEFSDVPVLCSKDVNDEKNKEFLVRGALYLRPRSGRPRTTRVYPASDLRELLDIATQKATQRLLQRARRAGMELSAGQDELEFQKQIDDFVALRPPMEGEAPYCRVVIHPVRFVHNRIGYSDLQRLMEQSRVRLHGRVIPIVDSGVTCREADYIQTLFPEAQVPEEADPRKWIHGWRFHQSGLFVLRAELDGVHGMVINQHGPLLNIAEVISYHRAAFKLASSLSGTFTDEGELRVDVQLHAILGAVPFARFGPRMPFAGYALGIQKPLTMPSWKKKPDTYSVDQLVAEPDELALTAVEELGKRFTPPAPGDFIRHLNEQLDGP